MASAAAVVVTDGDCSVTYDDGAGGDANSGVVVTDIGADCVVRYHSNPSKIDVDTCFDEIGHLRKMNHKMMIDE